MRKLQCLISCQNLELYDRGNSYQGLLLKIKIFQIIQRKVVVGNRRNLRGAGSTETAATPQLSVFYQGVTDIYQSITF